LEAVRCLQLLSSSRTCRIFHWAAGDSISCLLKLVWRIQIGIESCYHSHIWLLDPAGHMISGSSSSRHHPGGVISFEGTRAKSPGSIIARSKVVPVLSSLIHKLVVDAFAAWNRVASNQPTSNQAVRLVDCLCQQGSDWSIAPK
jgi:hypothetical protein